MRKFRRPLALIIAVVVALTLGAGTRVAALSTVQLGIDRSNMATEWSIGPPAEPKINPFTGSYNGAGVFEARRLAVLDGIASLHPAWFRDGFGADTATDAQLFVDLVSAVHARKMKILATIGFSGTDYAPQDRIPGNPAVCQWGTAPLSKINLASYAHRLRTHFDALKVASQSPDAFEIGNELDLHCNDADMPTISDFAKHHWTWFLSDAQVHAWAAGHAPVLKTAATLATRLR